MKCPYRKTTQIKHQYNADITTESFAECYGVECPFYVPAGGLNDEDCGKAREDGGFN